MYFNIYLKVVIIPLPLQVGWVENDWSKAIQRAFMPKGGLELLVSWFPGQAETDRYDLINE